jgi:hypothetical protein
MKFSRSPILAIVAAFSACGALLSPVVVFGQSPDEVEVLTRGPLHEAFAEAAGRDPEPGLLIDVAPPGPIDELPPDLQPEGDNVTWISGYWAWDEETVDFLWISGIWRNIPPDREWIPGYWAEAGRQYQWVSGYWANLEEEEVVYLPKPPASVESGPNVPQPSADQSWIPGGWVWSDTRYLWRPGYWEEFRDDWTYVPDCYQWTPRGYIYVGGYWDYPVVHRGVVFAPVHFSRGIYGRPDYRYSPTTVISFTLITSHLFIRPSYGHYYYGDYYDSGYRDRGFFASFSYHSGPRGGYDPIYAHERWEHRSDRDWDNRCRDDFEDFRENRDARPPRSYSKLHELADGRRGAQGRHGDYAIAAPIRHYEKEHTGQPHFKKVETSTHERLLAQRKAMGDFKRERKGRESSHASTKDKPDERAQAKTPPIKLHRSPVSGQKVEHLSKEKAPPQRRGGVSSGHSTGETARKTSPEPRRGESKSEPKAMPKSEPGRGDSKPESKPKSEPKVEPRRGESKPESKPKSEPRPMPKAEPRRGESKPESKPKSDPRPMPKVEPRRGESKPEKKSEPRVEPRRGESKPEKKSEPRVEPKRGGSSSEPKHEVQPQRKPEPRVEPKRSEPKRSEPKSEPKKESGSSRGGRDDDKKSKK